MKSSTPPPPPDPNVVSGAQTESNKETAQYNAAMGASNTYTPYGNSTFTPRVDPSTGATVYDQNIEFSPDQEKLYQQQLGQNLKLGDISNGMMNQVSGAYGGPMDTSGLPALQSPNLRTQVGANGLPKLPGADDLMGARQSAQDALYGRQTAYLDPQWKQTEDQTRTRLMNQGVAEGSEAWNNAMGNMSRQKEFSYGQARDSAIGGATGELGALSGIAQGNRAQMYGEALSDANFANSAELAGAAEGNQARSQGMQELFSLRNQPLNEFNALRSASPVTMPNFQGNQATPMNNTNVSSDIWNNYNAQMGISNANQASNNANISTGASVLGTAATAAAIFF